MRKENYFDNAASSPLDPRVLDAMLPWMRDGFGNAHSIHEAGRNAMDAVEIARTQVAELLGAEDPSEVVFTSGATESNNWVLRAFGSVCISPFEHSSIREPHALLHGSSNHSVLRNLGSECLPPDGPFELVSVMLVNNETGMILDPCAHRPPAGSLHSDVTQAIGKVRFAATDFDLASFSAHKLYGPMGVGGLYLRGAQGLPPLLIGGGQEQGQRSGTLNVAGIVGFGEAARIATKEIDSGAAYAWELRGIVVDALSHDDGLLVNESTRQSPYILSLSFEGLEGESIVVGLDSNGFAVGSGPACSAGVIAPSPVLAALGVDPAFIRGTIRVSFGSFNTRESTRNLANALIDTVNSLRKLKRA